MPIPNYRQCMVPVLKLMNSKDSSSLSHITKYIEEHFNLSEEEKKETLKNGQSKVYNTISWAVKFLLVAGLVNRKERGCYSINEAGKELLSQNPPQIIDKNFLSQNYPSFKEWSTPKKKQQQNSVPDDNLDPDESFEDNYQAIQKKTKDELLDRIKIDILPEDFEKLVLKLLTKLGYGLGQKNVHTGKSHDSGIDGEIYQDRFGLDCIYMQAKRYKDNSIGSREIRDFIGALDQKKSKKGIFITTSKFSKEARETAKAGSFKLRLIDGEELADLLYAHNIGVKVKYEVEYKSIDDDFFKDRNEYSDSSIKKAS